MFYDSKTDSKVLDNWHISIPFVPDINATDAETAEIWDQIFNVQIFG